MVCVCELSTGYRKELFLAFRNLCETRPWCEFFTDVFGTPTKPLENFYDAALANSNPVLHPARLMSLKKQIDKQGPFKRMPLFYEEWDDVASDYAIKLDSEIRSVALTKGTLLEPILAYYESTDIPSLTEKIKSIPAFKGIGSPITSAGVLDFSSRYILADINIALSYVARFASEYDISIPHISSVLQVFNQSKK